MFPERPVRNIHSGTKGRRTRVYFERYPDEQYHDHCVDLTPCGYPPPHIEPRVEVELESGVTMTVAASGFAKYFAFGDAPQ